MTSTATGSTGGGCAHAGEDHNDVRTSRVNLGNGCRTAWGKDGHGGKATNLRASRPAVFEIKRPRKPWEVPPMRECIAGRTQENKV
jgi:hypothetical protein